MNKELPVRIVENGVEQRVTKASQKVFRKVKLDKELTTDELDVHLNKRLEELESGN